MSETTITQPRLDVYSPPLEELDATRDERLATVRRLILARTESKAPGLVVMLSAFANREPLDEGNDTFAYRSLPYEDPPTGQKTLLGSRARVAATSATHKAFEGGLKLMTTGSQEPEYAAQDRPGPMREIMADELVRDWGIPRESIQQLESPASSTVGELLGALITAAKPETGLNQGSPLVVVSNEYHTPRIEAFNKLIRRHIEQQPEQLPNIHRLSGGFPKLVTVAAEDVLSARNPAFDEHFNDVKTWPTYQAREASEAEGIAAINEGTYTNLGDINDIESWLNQRSTTNR